MSRALLATRHIRNTDLATGPQSIGPTYEVCTNDMAQAIEWSERQATWQGQYSDLVEVRSDARLFEVVRVPRSDVSAMLRHRVFRCDYVDRAGSDLRSDSGAAGLMNQRPLTAVELEKLAEYLWQFTMFNNSDYAVESSVTATNGNSIVQTIRMGQLIRGASGCDTVQLVDWTHTLNTSDGSLSRALAPVRSFGVKNTLAGVAELRGYPRFLDQRAQVAAEGFRELRMRERVFHVGLQVAELAAAVVALARELVGVHRLVSHEPRDAVGELDLAARALAYLLQVREQAWREQVAAHHREV